MTGTSYLLAKCCCDTSCCPAEIEVSGMADDTGSGGADCSIFNRTYTITDGPSCDTTVDFTGGRMTLSKVQTETTPVEKFRLYITFWIDVGGLYVETCTYESSEFECIPTWGDLTWAKWVDSGVNQCLGCPTTATIEAS